MKKDSKIVMEFLEFDYIEYKDQQTGELKYCLNSENLQKYRVVRCSFEMEQLHPGEQIFLEKKTYDSMGNECWIKVNYVYLMKIVIEKLLRKLDLANKIIDDHSKIDQGFVDAVSHGHIEM